MTLSVVAVRRVEVEPLRVAQEVEVELHDHLGGRHVRLVVEERVREDVEEHGPRPVRHAQRVEEVRRRHPVVPAVGLRAGVGQQRQRRPAVDAAQLAHPQAGGAGHEREQVDRRDARQPGEVLLGPVPRHDRVAAEGPQEAEVRVDPAQHGTPVVVLAEEAVEAVVDPLRRAVGQGALPGREPAAQPRLSARAA